MRLKFIGRWAHIFGTVKNYYRLESNADVVRLLINNAFKEIMKEGVPPEQINGS